MAKDPTTLVEVERQIQLLQKADWSKKRFLTIGIIGVAVGAPVAIASALFDDLFFMVAGLFLLVAGIVNVTAAFWKPAAVARRIESLEVLAESMEKQSIETAEPAKAGEVSQSASQYQTCPFCAENIQSAAIVCRYCGHDLRKKDGWSAATREQARFELQAPSNPENGYGTAALIAGIVGLFLPIPFLAPLAAMILGMIGDHKVRTMRATNKGMAVGGAILGVVGFLGWLVITFTVILPWLV